MQPIDEPSPWGQVQRPLLKASHMMPGSVKQERTVKAVYDVETSQPEHHLLKVEADHIAKKVAVFGGAKKAEGTS